MMTRYRSVPPRDPPPRPPQAGRGRATDNTPAWMQREQQEALVRHMGKYPEHYALYHDGS